jgi:integrase
MATITKRGELQWQAKVRRKGQPPICRTFETRAMAEGWARSVEREMDLNTFIPRSDADHVTLAEALDRFESEYLPQLKHSDRYASRIAKLKRRPIAARILTQIKSHTIADFIRERQAEGVGPNTIRLDLALLSRLFNIARLGWNMENLSNPVLGVPRPRLPRGRERRFEPGEEERLLAAATPRLRPIILFALETAMRREEISNLEWKHIDFNRKTAFSEDTKNGESRSVPLSPAALEILISMPRHISGKVFNMSPEAITGAVYRICIKAHIDDFSLHDLRHEATSRLFENTDLDVMEIKMITGHKSLQMLSRYTHLNAHRLVDRLAGLKKF